MSIEFTPLVQTDWTINATLEAPSSKLGLTVQILTWWARAAYCHVRIAARLRFEMATGGRASISNSTYTGSLGGGLQTVKPVDVQRETRLHQPNVLP